MGKLLNAGEILGVKDLKSEVVSVPEWGGDVKIRELSASDREWFQSQAFVDEEVTVNGKAEIRRKFNIVHLRAKLLARSIVDENDNPIFDDDEVKLLGAKSNAAIERLFVASQKLSGLDQTAVDDAAKNSVAAPNSGSNSGSHSPSGEPLPNSTEVLAAAN
jgi:Phage tail assembly chaperone